MVILDPPRQPQHTGTPTESGPVSTATATPSPTTTPSPLLTSAELATATLPPAADTATFETHVAMSHTAFAEKFCHTIQIGPTRMTTETTQSQS